MKKILFTFLSAAFIITSLIASPVMSAPAEAQLSNAKRIVDQAKSQGVVGETTAGYLSIVSGSVSPEIVNAMNEINIRRKSVYTKKAREQNVQIEVIATITGEKLVAKAKPGEKVLDAAGNWVSAG